MPDTAQRFGVRQSFDPRENIKGGMRYLRFLLSHFQGDVTLALAAYNAGEGQVQKYQGVPPFPETQDYIQRIRSYYHNERHPYVVRLAANLQ